MSIDLRNPEPEQVDAIRDAVSALTRDLAWLDLVRSCDQHKNTAERYAELERQSALYVETTARALAELLA